MAYLTTAEITAIVALELTSTDERRTAWETLSAADQSVCAEQAQRDLDACNWIGHVEDTDAQADMWPRLDDAGESVLPGGEMTVPASLGVSVWTTLLIPAGIRRAMALQAAARAVRAFGYDKTRQSLEAAHAGVTGTSGPSGSTSFGQRATSPWANLDRDAFAATSGLRRMQGGLV